MGEKTERGLEWTAAPDLLKARHGHRSITIENKIYHIGGDHIGGDSKTKLV